jgi:alkyl hydroperoxide reductase subunit AhpC
MVEQVEATSPRFWQQRRLEIDDIACMVQTWRGETIPDLHAAHWPAGGSGGTAPNPLFIEYSILTVPQEVFMTVKIGDIAPDFEADTTQGRIRFHEWIGNSYCILFSHPKDFTPVCTTELGYMARIKPEFDKRNVKIIGLSVDPVGDHTKWAEDIRETQGYAPNYPIIGDPGLKISKLYDMLPASASGTSEGRTPADNQTVRNVFVIGPDKKIKLILVYPMTTGRNFDEVLRVIDSIQLTAKHRVATPVNWKQGEDVIIGGSVSDEEARKLYPQGWKAPRPYLRIVPPPAP